MQTSVNRGLLGVLMMLYEASAVLYEIYEVFEACDGRTCASAGAPGRPLTEWRVRILWCALLLG